MSLVYSDTSGKDGILQRLEQELAFPDGYITGDSTRLAQFTGSVNQSLDKAFHLIFKADGRWQFDDRNHTDYPIITTNLVDGQRSYAFTTDGSSNIILDIHRVAILPSASATLYQDINIIDVQADPEGSNDILSNSTTEGVPFQADLTANGVFLDPIPSYTATNGLKLWINREASYFATNSTSKTPGFAGLYHEYCVLEPAYRYARAHGLKNQETLKRDVFEMEKAITEYYSQRNKAERPVMRGRKIKYI